MHAEPEAAPNCGGAVLVAFNPNGIIVGKLMSAPDNVPIQARRLHLPTRPRPKPPPRRAERRDADDEAEDEAAEETHGEENSRVQRQF